MGPPKKIEPLWRWWFAALAMMGYVFVLGLAVALIMTGHRWGPGAAILLTVVVYAMVFQSLQHLPRTVRIMYIFFYAFILVSLLYLMLLGK